MAFDKYGLLSGVGMRISRGAHLFLPRLSRLTCCRRRACSRATETQPTDRSRPLLPAGARAEALRCKTPQTRSMPPAPSPSPAARSWRLRPPCPYVRVRVRVRLERTTEATISCKRVLSPHFRHVIVKYITQHAKAHVPHIRTLQASGSTGMPYQRRYYRSGGRSHSESLARAHTPRPYPPRTRCRTSSELSPV